MPGLGPKLPAVGAILSSVTLLARDGARSKSPAHRCHEGVGRGRGRARCSIWHWALHKAPGILLSRVFHEPGPDRRCGYNKKVCEAVDPIDQKSYRSQSRNRRAVASSEY